MRGSSVHSGTELRAIPFSLEERLESLGSERRRCEYAPTKAGRRMRAPRLTGAARLRLALLGIAALLALGASACSRDVTVQPATPIEETGISVSGIGRVYVQPDVAVISIGVETTAATVAEARDAAASAGEAVRDAVTAEGVAEEDLQTQSLNIWPQYAYDEGKSPRITGFTVSTFLQVKVRDIDTSSAVLDAAVSAGGDAARVNGIQFTVDNPEEHLNQARAAAMEEARQHAETLARAAGVSLGLPRTISESSGGSVSPPLLPGGGRDEAGGGGVPVEPGQQELTLTVSVVFDIER